MVFNATFNNISVISLRSVLLMEEIGVPRENHRSAASHWQTCHIKLYRVHLAMSEIRNKVSNGLSLFLLLLLLLCITIKKNINQTNKEQRHIITTAIFKF